MSDQPKDSAPRKLDTGSDSAPDVPSLGDMNQSPSQTARREWWQNLDEITIVAVPSLKDLPDPEREAARRWIEKTKSRKIRKWKNPKTSVCPFVVNASEEQIAKRQDEMLAELGVRGPVVWAAYRGSPANGNRIWVTGVPGADGGLSALYAHIRDEAHFKADGAAVDARRQPRVSVTEPPVRPSDGQAQIAPMPAKATADAPQVPDPPMIEQNQQQTPPTKGRRARGPALEKHKERMDLEDILIFELATIRERLGNATPTLEELHNRHPDFRLWRILSKNEQDELLAGEFKPKTYARNLTGRKFGVSAEAIKKGRQIVKHRRHTPSA